MKKLAVLFLMFIIVTGCDGAKNNQPENTVSSSPESSQQVVNNPEIIQEGVSALDSVPVSRGTAAKMIALTMLSEDEIKNLDYTITFEDVPKSQWYSPYINAVVNLGYMAGGDGVFNPESPLSVNEAQILMDKINPGNKTAIKITEENKNLPISYALWQQLYVKMLKELAGEKTLQEVFGLMDKELIILATPGNMSMLPSWSMITDKGGYFFKGFNIDAYIDKKVSAYIKGNETVMLEALVDAEPVIEGAYIAGIEEGNIRIFSGGAARTYKLLENIDYKPVVGDVKITKDGAVLINGYTENKNETIIKITEGYIELAGETIERRSIMPVYAVTGNGVSIRNINSLLPGQESISIYLLDGKAAAAVIENDSPIKNIRVLISGDYKQTAHTSIKIGSTSSYTVKTIGGTKKYSINEILEIDAENNPELFGSERLYIQPDTEDGRIVIQSIERNGEFPLYKGVIEVSKTEGAFEIVNELPFEEYLKSVAAAQMPEVLGLTAAKAQSVVSRSCGYNQYYANNYQAYGANVDDSVRCQQYNGCIETETSSAAVDATEGIVMESNGEIIKPYFFLASAGYTANSGEVWQKPGQDIFPAETPDYLKASKQFTKGEFGDLSVEENAAKFFKQNDFDAYEKDVSWIRWHVSMKREDIEASINASIKERYNAYPSQIKTLENGVFVSKPVNNIGSITDLSVTKRGEGGNIMELKVTSDTGEYLFITENTVRMLIRPRQYKEGGEDIMLTRSGGTRIANYEIMPSAFYVIDMKKDEEGITSVEFYGGGNGHGAGMSQCGAKALADAGKTYEDILKHYYNGTVLKNMYGGQSL